MKIIFLIRTLGYGGAERQLVTLAKELQRHGYSVTIGVFYPDLALGKELYEAEVKVVVLNKKGRWDVIGFAFNLFRLLHREKPNILYAFMGASTALSILYKPFFRNMKIIWGIRASNMELSRKDTFLKASFSIDVFLSRFADIIIANSNAGRDYHIKYGFPSNKIIVIPNGINTSKFCPSIEEGLKVRKEWGVGNDEILIGIVARLDPMKDHETFIQAAWKLTRQEKKVRFLCIGDGPPSYKEKLQMLCKKIDIEDKFIWSNARDDIMAVYNAIDILSSTSSYGEGFPNVIGEAMACGVPCVVTDVGDSALIVGETGLVVPSRKSDAVCQAWEKMLLMDRRDIAIKARFRIEQNFSLENAVQRTIEACYKGYQE